MSEDFDWTPFEGNRWTAETVGDELIGQITRLRTEKDRQGNPVPVLTVSEKDTNREQEVWATIQLRQVLADENPQVGDLIAMKLTELKNTGQPKPMKVFAVKVKKTEAAASASADDEFDESRPF